MREGSGGFDGEAKGTAGRAREKRGEWVCARQFQRRRGRLGKKKLMGGVHQSVRARGNRVDWAGTGLANHGSAQCCLFSFFLF
jgi:hypothetical protein